MDNWLRERLFSCLEFEIPNDMIKYIMSIDDCSEFDDYFDTLLNKDCEKHRLFLADCKQRLFSKKINKKSNSEIASKKLLSSQGSPKKIAPTPKKSDQLLTKSSTGSKKKTKFVSLYASDGNVTTDTILLKGRRKCDCEATEHKLINNCLSCGRIVCVQEGSGPCLFCGALVCTNEEMQIIKSSSKKGDILMKSLKEKGDGESLRKAMEERDRLLEYDRNSEKRTIVIDDEMDYFQETSVWLSDKERAKMQRLKDEMSEKKHAGRAQRKIKVDFAGRETEDNELLITEEYENKILKEVGSVTYATSDNWSNQNHQITPNTLIDPSIDSFRPIYKEVDQTPPNQPKNIFNDGLERCYNRVQDEELLEMQDLGQCLSIHQPFASLLIAGIKKHEGRVWYSGHRGRLWISSTTKEPNREEIEELEMLYRSHYKDKTINFPETYPTGCLLGCVKVEECLPQEEYRELYPNGESDSPYVFICSYPEQLQVVFPIKGDHKIYKIDPKIHIAALKALIRPKMSSR